jgi:L-ascorbate metabolism protein UlaG (beta-lactamase superfamily)
MKYSFLGHQSWLFQEGSTKILLDPLLQDTFGVDPKHGIEIVPPRLIQREIYQDADAVLLSHEHSDHFHPASLSLLRKGIPVYVGELTLEPVIWTLGV